MIDIHVTNTYDLSYNQYLEVNLKTGTLVSDESSIHDIWNQFID